MHRIGEIWFGQIVVFEWKDHELEWSKIGWKKIGSLIVGCEGVDEYCV